MGGRAPWTDARLRAAWARRDWSAVFREYRRAAGGISQRDLAQLVDMWPARVSEIESGRRRPTSAAVIARITGGLAVPEELGGDAPRPTTSQWHPPAELRERIAHAQRAGRADIRTADWIRRVLAEHRRAEDTVGGRDLWPVVSAQLDAVTRLLPAASGDAADRLLVLAAEHGHWLSWVAHQHRELGAALAWLDTAAGWSAEAGASSMTSWLGRVRSYYQLTGGDPVRALRTAEAARWSPTGLDPASASIAAHATAMAAAAVGERDRARRAADEALDLALRAPSEEERPGWLYWLDPTRARLLSADAAYAVRDWGAAAEGYREALGDLVGYPRDHAYYAQRAADAEQRAA
ncbi:helix-turn-helix domain-containing protein [Streptomyces sp. HD1123-B1]|uniref:helix-turn-helix domain-containing protein n=1 Tax=Streptomyces huangiella TaxID=3228804 RepID=UPI003D7CA1AF